MIDYNVSMTDQDLLRSQLKTQGYLLYSSIPVLNFTGFYRLLSVKNFSPHVGYGLAFDLLQTLVLIFLQGVNNSTVSQSKGFTNTPLQSTAMLVNLAVVLDLIFEMIMYGFELCQLHNLTRERIDVIVKYSEEQRRIVYGAKYAKLAILTLSVFLVALITTLIMVEPLSCPDSQLTIYGHICTTCLVPKCESCTASNDPNYCD